MQIRANSFFCASSTGVENVTRAHQVAWSENSAQGAASESHTIPIAIQTNGRNWEVSDCDIYSSWGVFSQPHTARLDPQEMGAYGYLARNKLYNGKGSTVDCDGPRHRHCFTLSGRELGHFGHRQPRFPLPACLAGCDRAAVIGLPDILSWPGAKQWIVEDNQVTGVSPMSGGNSIATGEAAFMHHLYWGKNRFQFDWGQDRGECAPPPPLLCFALPRSIALTPRGCDRKRS